jgi:hypothetical protein
MAVLPVYSCLKCTLLSVVVRTINARLIKGAGGDN